MCNGHLSPQSKFEFDTASEATAGLDSIVQRIRRIAAPGLSHPDASSLLHAYIACLSPSDLCLAITETAADPSNVRLAMRRRLLRMLREGNLPHRDYECVQDLIERSRAVSRENPTMRPFVESLLSAVFEYLPLPQQQSIIETWIDRGTRGTAARWLKAAAQVPALFDETAVMAYFRSGGDQRAAKSLAYQASPPFLGSILSEIVDRCDEGWIVSKAAMRAQAIDGAVWSKIRSKHPATYLYLRARSRCNVSEAEALELVMNCQSATRGLAIWAIGQMGMSDTLDQVVQRREELIVRDLKELNRFIG